MKKKFFWYICLIICTLISSKQSKICKFPVSTLIPCGKPEGSAGLLGKSAVSTPKSAGSVVMNTGWDLLVEKAFLISALFSL